MSPADVLSRGLHAFDQAAWSVRVGGVPFDAPTFRADVAEQLAAAACAWWYRAVDVAPVLLNADGRIITRALSEGTKAARKSAVAEIERSVRVLEAGASDGRTSCLGDLSHLSRQDALRLAGPRLALAKMLLQMAD